MANILNNLLSFLLDSIIFLPISTELKISNKSTYTEEKQTKWIGTWNSLNLRNLWSFNEESYWVAWHWKKTYTTCLCRRFPNRITRWIRLTSSITQFHNRSLAKFWVFRFQAQSLWWADNSNQMMKISIFLKHYISEHLL